jgi:general secretion pathway protein L
MLPELITWWTRQMGDLFAPVLNRARTALPDALLLAPGPNGISVARRRQGRMDAATTVPDDALRSALARRRENLVLSLPSPMLIREATLPAAALGGLDRVLRYEMDRLTPFGADDVYFSHRLLSVDQARSTLQVELAFLPRARVRPVLDRLANAGARPAVLEARGPDGVIRRIGIAALDAAQQARERLLTRLAAILCGALAVSVVAAPVLRQSMALSEVEDRIALLRPRVDQVETLRKRIAASKAGTGKIAAARKQAGAVLEILEVLTDTVPDDTWLTTLSLRQRSLVLEGHSAAATRLLAAIGAASRFRDPSFAAPVLRAGNGGEVFTIRTEFGF